MDQFYEKVNDPVHKGAVFFAVCRGKVSKFFEIYLLFSQGSSCIKVIKSLYFAKTSS